MRNSKLWLSLLLCALSAPAHPSDLVVLVHRGEKSAAVISIEKASEVVRMPLTGQGVTAYAGRDFGGIFVLQKDPAELLRFETDGVQTFLPLRLDGIPSSMVADDSRFHLIISDVGNDRLWIVEPDRMTVVATVAVGNAPTDVVLSSDREWIVTVDSGDNGISMINAGSLVREAEIRTGTAPESAAFGPDGLLYVANTGGNTVSVVDVRTRKILRSIPTGVRPLRVGFVDEKGFVTNAGDGSLTIFELETGRVALTIPIGTSPNGVMASPDQRSLIVINGGDDNLSVLDVESLKVTDVIKTGDMPFSGNGFIWDD